jgi:hypothetical protein
LAPAPPVPSFLIVGTPRSGTTLVQRLACELPGVDVPPETHFFSLLAPALLDRRSFPLPPAAVLEEFERFAALRTSCGLEFDPRAGAERLPLGADRPLDLFAAIVSELAQDAAIVGEKTPNHLLWWRPLVRAAPRLRWVVVVRDPRAVVASYRESWGARDHVVLAERWRSDQREAAALLDELGPAQALLLRYEDVVDRPAEARDALAAFVGAARGSGDRPDAPAPVARPAETSMQGAATPIALPWETWKRGAIAPTDAGRKSAWRGVLSSSEAAAVAAIAGAGMERFGYRAPPRLARAARAALIAPGAQRHRARFRLRRALKLRRNARLGRRLAAGSGDLGPSASQRPGFRASQVSE